MPGSTSRATCPALGPPLGGVLVTDGPAGASAARRLVRATCHEAGRPDLVDDACLVASELVANAIVHAPGRCELRVRFGPSSLRIEVLDDGGGTPEAREAAEDDERGRGLAIVDHLSSTWGVDRTEDDRKAVWAELVEGR